MTPPSAAPEPTPLPIRELPAEIEEVIEQFGVTCHVCGMDEDPPHLVWAVGEEKKKVHETIRAALAEAADTAWHDGYGQCFNDDKPLRERCERLEARLAECEGGIIEP